MKSSDTMPAMELAGNFSGGPDGLGQKPRLAAHWQGTLAKPFYDSDHEIERRTGVRITTIFDIEGEPKFQ